MFFEAIIFCVCIYITSIYKLTEGEKGVIIQLLVFITMKERDYYDRGKRIIS